MKMKNKYVLKRETVYFIKAFYIIVLLMYFCALMSVSVCSELFPDKSTGFYWFSEIMNSANRVMFIGILVSFCCEKIVQEK